MAPQAADASSFLTPLEQGQLLSKQAYAEPPIVPTGLALSIVIVILIFTALSTIVIALRIYVRAWMEKTLKTWGWEDTFIVLGYVSISPRPYMMELLLPLLSIVFTHQGIDR